MNRLAQTLKLTNGTHLTVILLDDANRESKGTTVPFTVFWESFAKILLLKMKLCYNTPKQFFITENIHHEAENNVHLPFY